jgi:MFS family permease
MTTETASVDTLARGSATRNVLALIGDFIFFSIGFAFYDPLVVVPAFVNEFTGSQILVGVFSTLRVLMITVPQIWAASVLEARPRAKPLLVWSSVGGRLPILLLSVSVFQWAETRMALVMVVLAFSAMLFFTSEGLNGVSWPALGAKAVPEGFRGRFFGLGQFFSSLGAAAAGYVVNRILALQSLERASRWSLLFILGFVWLMLSVVSMLFIRERPAARVSDRPDVRESFRKVRAYLREDRWLRRVILVQLVIATPAATFAFFVVRARQIIPDADTMIGTFVMLQSVGSAVAALVGGWLVDRVGSWAAICATAGMGALALAAVTVGGLATAPLPFYLMAFLLMGFFNGAAWWSFSAYLLDMAPEARRPIYLATSGILASVTVLNPLIAGALFEALQPELVFGAASLLAVVGLALAWTLRQGVPARTPAG